LVSAGAEIFTGITRFGERKLALLLADADHGRVETRKYTAIHDIVWLQARHNWPGLEWVIMIESKREFGDKTERETRFYITSLTLPACRA
jgi:hypothetical protein